MKKKQIILIIISSGVCLCILIMGILHYRENAALRAQQKAQNQAIEDVISSRKARKQAIDDIVNAYRQPNSEDSSIDPFGEDNQVNILFIGLDTRAGQKNGHCDAIQFISIDSKNETVAITAVPRGTYSPLPSGTGSQPSDYYVSNACALGGLEYGITQIEKILGKKADYIVVIGFSQAMGIFRNLKLPTAETLQWLRNRHGYQIGEPQRAHNHSMFIKQMITKFVPVKKSALDTALEYIIYRLVKTDLSFAQARQITEVLSTMDITNNPEKISLYIRPFYPVQDISYDSENIDDYLEQTLGPIKEQLSSDDYSGVTRDTLQEKLLHVIDQNKTNADFVIWAYSNNLWLQIDDANTRLSTQYNLLAYYLTFLNNADERKSVIADYILEMENTGEFTWKDKGETLLAKEIME